MRKDVAALATSDGRMVGTVGHSGARDHLLGRLRGLQLIPYLPQGFVAGYKSGQMTGYNLLGVLPGRDRSLAPAVVGAHYDSVIRAPCADDNAAAVAMVLALAERLGPGALERDLVLAFFDAEEPPWFLTEEMGSVRFYEDQLDERGVHCAVILDLVGHDVRVPGTDRLDGLVFVTGAESHGELPETMRSIPPVPGLPVVFTLNDYVGDMSDHGIFRRNGVPYLFFSCGRWEHYHQPTDTPDLLSFEKMSRIVLYLSELFPRLDQLRPDELEGGPPRRPRDPHARADTLELEIESLAAAFGDAVPGFEGGAPKTRADLGRIVNGLISGGL